MKLHCPICGKANLWAGEIFVFGDTTHRIVVCDSCPYRGYYSKTEKIFKDLDLNPIFDGKQKKNQKESK